MKPYIIIAYIIAMVIAGAVADGLNYTGLQSWGHLLETLEIAMLFGFAFLFKIVTWDKFLFALGAYICFRVAGFDYMYNWAAGNLWSYMGGQNAWDLFLVKVPPHGLVFIRTIFLATGTAFVIKELK